MWLWMITSDIVKYKEAPQAAHLPLGSDHGEMIMTPNIFVVSMSFCLNNAIACVILLDFNNLFFNGRSMPQGDRIIVWVQFLI